MRRSEPAKKHPLDEWSDDDDELAASESSAGSSNSDLRAVKCTIYNGHCAWRNPKKKEKADPYLIITCLGETRQATQLYGTTHPKWNETFEFPCEAQPRGQLIIEMWDANNKPTKKGQIFMGEMKLNLADIADVDFGFCEARPYKFEPRARTEKTDNVAGDLTVKLGMVFPRKTFKGSSGAVNGKTLEQLNDEAEDLIDDSFQSVQRSVRTAENMRGTLADTLDLLEAQGDQLARIQEKADNIIDYQKRADRDIMAIQSLGGYVLTKVAPGPSRASGKKDADKKVAQVRKRADREDRKAEKKEQAEEEVYIRRGRGNSPYNNMYGADLSGLSLDAQEKARLTDEGLDTIGDIVSDVLDMARESGRALDQHNAQIDVLVPTIRKADNKMKEQNRKIGRRGH